jgi:hypothetical protein
MSHLPFWIITCLLGWTSLQATTALTDSSEAHCKLRLIEEVSVLVAPGTYAFVYADTKKEVRDTRGDFLATSPLIFNSKGPIKNMTYAAGQATVPTAGSYQVIYSIVPSNAANAPDSFALAVNGKEIRASRISLLRVSQNLVRASFILKLAQGDHVSLVLPGTSRASLSLKPGINASLLVTKL